MSADTAHIFLPLMVTVSAQCPVPDAWHARQEHCQCFRSLVEQPLASCLVGSPLSTWRISSRFSVHLLWEIGNGYAELSPVKLSSKKGYLVRRVQYGFQPISETSLEIFVHHGLIHSLAQSKKITRSNNLCSQFQPLLPNSRRTFA